VPSRPTIPRTMEKRTTCSAMCGHHLDRPTRLRREKTRIHVRAINILMSAPFFVDIGYALSFWTKPLLPAASMGQEGSIGQEVHRTHLVLQRSTQQAKADRRTLARSGAVLSTFRTDNGPFVLPCWNMLRSVCCGSVATIGTSHLPVITESTRQRGRTSLSTLESPCQSRRPSGGCRRRRSGGSGRRR